LDFAQAERRFGDLPFRSLTAACVGHIDQERLAKPI